MSIERRIQVPKTTDSALLRIVEELSATRPSQRSQVQIIGTGNLDLSEEHHSSLKAALSASNGYSIINLTFDPNPTGFVFRRLITVLSPNGAEGRMPSPYFDEIELTGATLESAAETIVLSRELVEKFGVGQLAPQTASDSLNDYASSVAQLIAASIQQSRDLLAETNSALLKTRNKLEQEFSDRRLDADRELAAQRNELEEQYRQKQESIKAEAQQLSEIKKQLDDRNNTHARRELQSELRKKIIARSEKFELTPETLKLRWPIHLVCLIGLGLLGTGAVAFGYELVLLMQTPNSGASVLTVAIVRQLGFTFAFLALLAYYIRWMNRWFDKHADAEFQLKQFALDIDRASWVVESGLEWRREQGGPIPDLLLSSLTRDLFKSTVPNGSHDELHPADYLASALLGSASSVDLRVPGGSLSYDKKGVKKLKKGSGHPEEAT